MRSSTAAVYAVAIAAVALVVQASTVRRKRSTKDQVKTATDNLKAKLTRIYGTEVNDDAVKALQQLYDELKDTTDGANLQKYLEGIRKVDQAVDKISSKTLKDVAAGVGVLAQVGLMVALPPPFGAALGALAGAIGALLGRGGTMRLSTVIDELLKKRLEEARFREIVDKSEGALRSLRQVHSFVGGMMKIDLADWTSEDVSTLNNQAKTFEGLKMAGEIEKYMERLRNDPARHADAATLILIYSNLFYIRTTIHAMMLNVYKFHNMRASASGAVTAIDDEKIHVQNLFRYVENPTANEAPIVLNLNLQNHPLQFAFLRVLGFDPLKSQKTLVNKCYRVHAKGWSGSWYWAAMWHSHRRTMWVDDDSYSDHGPNGAGARINVYNSGSNNPYNSNVRAGFISMKTSYQNEWIAVGKEPYYGGGRATSGGAENHLIVKTAQAYQGGSKHNYNFRAVKLKDSEYWYISGAYSGCQGTPLYVRSYDIICSSGHYAVGDAGKWKLKPC